MSADTIPVEQVDRCEAAETLLRAEAIGVVGADAIIAGNRDDHFAVQAFARHRLSAESAHAEGWLSREAVAREVKRARFKTKFGNDYRADDERLDHIELDAADAILALFRFAPASDGMGEPTEAEVERAARHLRETQQAGKMLTPWDRVPKSSKRKWIELAWGTLRAAQSAATSEESSNA